MFLLAWIFKITKIMFPVETGKSKFYRVFVGPGYVPDVRNQHNITSPEGGE